MLQVGWRMAILGSRLPIGHGSTRARIIGIRLVPSAAEVYGGAPVSISSLRLVLGPVQPRLPIPKTYAPGSSCRVCDDRSSLIVE